MKSKNNSSAILTGVGIGMTIGGISALAGSAMVSRRNGSPAKRRASRAMSSISDFVDNLQSMMR